METQEQVKRKVMFECSGEIIKVNFGRKKSKITRGDINNLSPREDANNLLPIDIYNRLGRDMHRIADFLEMVICSEDEAVLFLSKYFNCNGLKETVREIKKKLLERI